MADVDEGVKMAATRFCMYNFSPQKLELAQIRAALCAVLVQMGKNGNKTKFISFYCFQIFPRLIIALQYDLT